MKKSAGKLFLIPNTLGDTEAEQVLPGNTSRLINHITDFVAEEEKSARRLLKKLNIRTPQNELRINLLNEHTSPEDVPSLLAPLNEGKDVGLITEAGCPAIADPGSALVLLAHRNNISVVPLTGPSSITLALMASGLNGQNFSFCGYLPKGREERRKKIIILEKDSRIKNQTQVFIETPYRNLHLFDDLCDLCNGETLLCIAADLTLPNEFISTKKISEWKTRRPDINKKPAVFLILA